MILVKNKEDNTTPVYQMLQKLSLSKTTRSYANVWDPKSINGGAPKYSVSLIISGTHTPTVEKIKAAIQTAYEEGESRLRTARPYLHLVLKTPLRDGDLAKT